MSQTCGVALPSSHYFDEAKKIWYTEDGVAITTLHLASLEKELSQDHVSDYFTGFGNVNKVEMKDASPHFFGFVTFTQPESAAKALDVQFHTIFGRQIIVSIAEREHQSSELIFTAGTATIFLDLNDDCLLKILSPNNISRDDLCSVARTNVRLKEIANQIFRSKYTSCDLRINLFREYNPPSRRILVTFGSMISELFIGEDDDCLCPDYCANLLDLATECCSVEVLKSLQLNDFYIAEELTEKLMPFFSKLLKLSLLCCPVYGNKKELLDACESLVELKISDEYDEYYYEPELILETTFPKLERFEWTDLERGSLKNLKSFIMRHKNLKRFSSHRSPTSVLSTIAENCKELEELEIDCSRVAGLKNLLSLVHLKKLAMDCADKNITKFLKKIVCIKSLEFLQLWRVKADSEFIPALSKLQSLQVLRLKYCDGVNDLNQLGDLDQLIELSIDSCGNPLLHGVLLINRLTNLKALKIDMGSFDMNKNLYQRILDVVRGRPERSQQILQITCRFPLNLKDHGYNPQILKLEIYQPESLIQ